ncbi:hypothetical protein ACI77I_25985 [Pseudomonas sp. D47]|uniref:hypothetical protein n=1 Tax=Pseudomonas sp. D47 TaxID=3159447 RepID=UPI00387B42BF
MTALTGDRNTHMQDAGVVSVPMVAGAVIYAGALVVANPSGFCAPGWTADDVVYIGRAEESVSNAGGGNGAKHISVRRLRAFKWATDGSISQANFMAMAYIVDDQTVSASDASQARSVAGRIVGVESDGVWVE